MSCPRVIQREVDSRVTLRYKVNMRRTVLPAFIAAVGLLCVGVAYLCLYAFSVPHVFVGLGVPIRQDDFTYTVTAVGKAKAVGKGSQAVRARGIFYLVTVRLDNHALRVPYEWDDRVAHVVDADGTAYGVAPQVQAQWSDGHPPSHLVPAGGHASFQLAFDIPQTATKPALAFSNGILMGDVFDLVAYRRTGVALY
jgi:Domain of unknown function (DUF4352)